MENDTMDGVFKEIGGKTIVDQIVDDIANAIINGEIKPGDRIPTEAELAKSMNVGRNSVREAIKILVAYGVLKIKRAEGTFVRQEFSRKMLYPILYGIILQKDFNGQIIELRKILDVGLLELVLDKLDQDYLKRAEEALQELKKVSKKAKVTPEEMFDADVHFHRVLAEVAQNKLLEGISHYVDKISRPSRILTIKRFLDDDAVDVFLAKHEEIIRLLRDRDRKAINRAITNHYQYWIDTEKDLESQQKEGKPIKTTKSTTKAKRKSTTATKTTKPVKQAQPVIMAKPIRKIKKTK